MYDIFWHYSADCADIHPQILHPLELMLLVALNKDISMDGPKETNSMITDMQYDTTWIGQLEEEQWEISRMMTDERKENYKQASSGHLVFKASNSLTRLKRMSRQNISSVECLTISTSSNSGVTDCHLYVCNTFKLSVHSHLHSTAWRSIHWLWRVGGLRVGFWYLKASTLPVTWPSWRQHTCTL